jgi:hypothetical protein
VSLLERSRSIAGRARHAVVIRRQTHGAVAQARTFVSGRRGVTRVCWDLDNTLADSGSLLRSGKTLAEAIVAAQPVPNMPEFFRALQMALPDADHFVLSARLPSMRLDTLAWLRGHLGEADLALCLVPNPDAKMKVWRSLAAAGPVVIVDDLSFGHEGDQPSVYAALVETARKSATAYVGLEEIRQIAGDRSEVAATVESVLASLGPRAPSAEGDEHDELPLRE